MNANRQQRLAYGVLLLGVAINCRLLWPAISGPDEFDALHTYLPLAAKFLQLGFHFFAMEESLQAPPFAWLWFALLGPDLAAIRTANVLVSAITLVAVFRCAWLLHSPLAAGAAVCLFVASPLLRPYLAPAMTEPPYILLCALWFWGHVEGIERGRRWALIAGAAALALAALTRATMFFWIVALVLGSGYLALRAQPAQRPGARLMLAVYLAALAVPLAVAAKNWILFDYPFHATGSGNSLYLGNNPLTGGYEPHYVGLAFDVGAITGDSSHLTLRSDRLLAGAARAILEDKGMGFLAAMHLQKVAAFVFVSGAVAGVVELRTWRIVLALLCLALFIAGKDARGRLLLAAVIAYQVGIHMPVLYTHRYSVGAIDLWLVLGAALGIATLVSRKTLAGGAVLAGLVGIGFALGRAEPLLGRPMPDVFAVARELVWESPRRPLGTLSAANTRIDLAMTPTHSFQWWLNHVIVVDLSPAREGDRCAPLSISYRAEDRQEFGPAVELPIGHHPRRARFQMGAIALQLAGAGTLRIEGRCPGSAALPIERVAIYAARGALEYRARALHQPFPVSPGL